MNNTRKKIVNTPLKKIIYCRKCFFTFKHTTKKGYAICPKCNNKLDVRDRSKWSKAYSEKHPERKEAWKNYVKNADKKEHRDRQNLNERKRVLMLVGDGKLKCVRCGCDNMKLLEINHKNGGGKKDFECGKYAREFYRKIIRLERGTNDLEILCKVCNAWHALELKNGKLPFNVKWNG